MVSSPTNKPWRGCSISVNDPVTTEPLTNDRPQSKQFESFVLECLSAGLRVRFTARGASMSPAIRDGETVYVRPACEMDLQLGDIVLVKSDSGFRLHRLARVDSVQDMFITRGDSRLQDDPAVRRDQILGVATAKDVRLGPKILRTKFRGTAGPLLQAAARTQFILRKISTAAGLRAVASRVTRRRVRNVVGALGLLAILLAATYARAQVAVDSETDSSANLKSTGTKTLTFAHTTTATGTNVLLLVGVSINLANVPTTTISGVTYNGIALTSAGTHADTGPTRLVAMYYMLAPPAGANNVVVSVAIPAKQMVGVTAGAITFTGVDQTSPLGTFVFADGLNGANSQLNVPSVVNGMVLDTLATGGDQTVTVSGPQASQWNNASSGTAPPGVTGTGSTRSGAPSVPISETFSGTSDWSVGAVSINPAAADIGVTTTVGTVFLGQNTTYNIAVSNNGPSPANAVTLSDTLASGMTLLSATPSTGSCNTSANPITCSFGTLNSGSTVTVAVVETAAASGSFSNTATVADSGTPPDPNTGNNTFVSVATVQSVSCA